MRKWVLMLFLLGGVVEGQVWDAPRAYTEHYKFRMWGYDDNPGADSLNANWRELDSVIYLKGLDTTKDYTIRGDWKMKKVEIDTLVLSNNLIDTVIVEGRLVRRSDLENTFLVYGIGLGEVDTLASMRWVRDSVGSVFENSGATITEGDAYPSGPKKGDMHFWTGDTTGGMVHNSWYWYGGSAWVRRGLRGTYITSSGVYTGVVNADQVIAGILTGFTIRTSDSGQRVEIDNSNSIKFYAPDSTLVGSITAYNDGTVGDYVGISGTLKAGEIRGTAFKARDWSYLSENISTELSTTKLRFNNTIDWTSVSQIDVTVGEAVSNYEPVLKVNGAEVASRTWVGNRGYLTAVPTATDATKIADGSITNTEFQYLDGLGGRIIDLLANKVDTGSSYSNPGWITSLAFSKISGFVTSGGSSGYYVATSSGGSPTTQLAYYVVGGYKFLYVP